MKQTNSRAIIAKLSLATAVFTILVGCAPIFISFPMKKVVSERVVSGSGNRKIAIVELSGAISDQKAAGGMFSDEKPSMMETILRTFDRISRDKAVKAVILRVNSPGGTVTASDILYHEIKAFKNRTGLPVVAHFLDVAASGGYYVSMAADRIVATPTTITGSIGVIVSSFNIVALIDKIGVRYNPYKSAAGKDLGSPFKPENEADRKVIQTIVDDMYGRFKSIVVEGRGTRLKTDIATVADGRVVTANEALKIGLIDEIGYMDAAVNLAKRLARISDARVVIYTTAQKEPNLGLYSEAGAYRNAQLVDAVLDLLVAGERPGFYYLWK